MEASNLQISIIVPVYNVRPFLTPCVNSVLNQTLRELELILVDDGSTDGSGIMCDEIALRDTRVQVIHQKNAGLAAARNAGLRAAKAPHVMFLDSDDYYRHANFLKVLCDYVKKRPTEIVCFQFKQMPESEPVVLEQSNSLPRPQPCTPIDLIKKNQYQSSACIKLLQTRFLQQQHLSFPIGRLSEDVLFSGQLLLKCKTIAWLPLQAYGYRIRPGSITASIGKKHFEDLLWAVEQLATEPHTGTALGGYLAYQYCTVLINWARSNFPNQNNEERRLRALQYLLKNNNYPPTRLVRWAATLCGIKTTAKLLAGVYRRKIARISP